MVTHMELAPAADEGFRAEAEVSSGRGLGLRVAGSVGVGCRV